MKLSLSSFSPLLLLLVTSLVLIHCTSKNPKLPVPTALQSLPEGVVTIPLTFDTCNTKKDLTVHLPFTFAFSDSITVRIDKYQTFLHIWKDSCSVEHVLLGKSFLHNKEGKILDSGSFQRNEVSDTARMPALNRLRK